MTFELSDVCYRVGDCWKGSKKMQMASTFRNLLDSILNEQGLTAQFLKE